MIAEKDAGLDLNGHGQMDNDRNHISTVDGRWHFINAEHYGETGWYAVRIHDEEAYEVNPVEVAEYLYEMGMRWWKGQGLSRHKTYADAYAFALTEEAA